jgi:hypothetical protein
LKRLTEKLGGAILFIERGRDAVGKVDLTIGSSSQRHNAEERAHTEGLTGGPDVAVTGGDGAGRTVCLGHT